MAYQNTSATDYDDLLAKLYSFATVTDGNWTGVYNQTGQIAMYADNCYVALGTRSGENPISRLGGSYYDAQIHGSLSTSLNSGPPYQYWGHPGSPVTTETDSDRVIINDVLGSMTNVWFFSGDTGDPRYIHVIVQSAGDRYAHFSLGNLDKLGMTTPNCAYLAGMYYEWWPNSGYSNDPADGSHEIGVLADELYSQVYVPTSVLPAGYPTSYIGRGIDRLVLVMTRVTSDASQWSAGAGKILDFFFPTDNQLTTGGTALYGIPWFFTEDTTGTSMVFLGNVPGMRIANIANHIPASTLYFGSDEWMIFPWKRKGLEENLVGGSNPLLECNTVHYGFAYKKIT
jgi:hypothetical protein